MAVTAARTADVAKALDSVFDGTSLRTYWWTPDSFRPPGVVIGLPDIDFTDTQSGFCRASWNFPLTVIVSRNQDREAHRALSDLVGIVTTLLADAEPAGIFSIEPLDARPVVVNVNGTDLPAYNINVRVRA